MIKRQKLAVMCNELATVRAITDAVGRSFELTLTGDAQTLRNVLHQEEPPAAVMIDIAAVQVDAIKLLDLARSECSTARRILLTDFCDLRIIVQGLHTGTIERIVYKPIHAPELLGAIGAQGVVIPSVPTNSQQQTRVAG
ncbi:MAG TPA: hypothetical protein VKK61_05445 [Tepidisphaeraceae bacterium]|nr:hypothetical protein [Tepidisphaeraceae bacterium]